MRDALRVLRRSRDVGDEYSGGIDRRRDDADRQEAQRIFEFRLLRLEKTTEERERRVSLLESKASVIDEKVSAMVQDVRDATTAVQAIREGQGRTMNGIIVAIITVLATFLLGHFGPIAR